VIPETWAQVTVVLACIVPGFVYQVSRRRVAGPDPEQADLGERLLHAIASTAVFAGVYALLAGPQIRDYVRSPTRALDDVQLLGVYFVIFAIVVPWAAARVVFYVGSNDKVQAWRVAAAKKLHTQRAWDPTPSAWDFAFSKGTAGWVRVQLSDGRWLGGWFSSNSYASSYPNPQELFVEVGYLIDENGTFTTDVHAPGGLFIRCTDALSVDFLPAEPDTEDHEPDTEDRTNEEA